MDSLQTRAARQERMEKERKRSATTAGRRSIVAIGGNVALIFPGLGKHFLLAFQILVADKGGENAAAVVLAAKELSLARGRRFDGLKLHENLLDVVRVSVCVGRGEEKDTNPKESGNEATFSRTGNVEINDGAKL